MVESMNGLTISDVSKRFGQFTALDQISLAIGRGQLCGLAGHNGAGKSTLMNILCGAVTPDTGSILVHGKAYRPRSYRDATRAGIFRVSQELTLFENLSVMDNAVFGLEEIYTHGGFLSRRQIRHDLTAFLDSIGLTMLPLDARVGDLPLALKQLTEIARCLFSAFKHGITEPILLFDEPTSGLTHSQAEFVAATLRRLADRAIIILTSHRGRELLDLSHRVVVLRAGRLVGDRPSAELDPLTLEELMTGVVRLPEARGARVGGADVGAIALEVEAPGIAEPITVRAGEIVGLAGEGEGKSWLLAAVAGWRRNRDVVVKVDGQPLGGSAPLRARHGIRYVPGERAREGFSVWQPITWNVTIPHVARGGAYRRFPMHPERETRFVKDLVNSFGVRVPDVAGPIASLSGGNQQRLLVARTLDQQARILLCDRPTRGVDVTATAEVHAAIRRAAGSGIACLVASDEPEELEKLCDRITTLAEA
jgi:ABC-type sugar transport system ATPase subunit